MSRLGLMAKKAKVAPPASGKRPKKKGEKKPAKVQRKPMKVKKKPVRKPVKIQKKSVKVQRKGSAAKKAEVARKRPKKKEGKKPMKVQRKGSVVKKAEVVSKRPKKKGGKKSVKVQRKRFVAKKTDGLESAYRTRIRVVGVGGGGGNIISEIASRVQRVDFVAANTDSQALGTTPRKVKTFSFGHEFTKGLGCGMDSMLGEQAATTEKERIKKIFDGQDISIIVASLGGGTGSGSTPVFAEVAREFKNLTLGIFTMPFPFEGEKRKQLAEQALEKLKGSLNAYVVIPNKSIFRIVTEETPLGEAFSAVNRRLTDTIEGLIDMISVPGLINIDFADVKATLDGRGKLAYINSATASGSAKVQQALQEVLSSPISDYGAEGVERMLFNITGEKALKMYEVARVSKAISDYNPKARIVFGISCTPKFKDKIRITLFAVGCKDDRMEKTEVSPREFSKKNDTKSSGSGNGKKEPAKGRAKKLKRKKAKTSSPPPFLQREPKPEPKRVRRNAMDVKKAVEQEMQDLQEKEKRWDIPTFLRNKAE